MFDKYSHSLAVRAAKVLVWPILALILPFGLFGATSALANTGLSIQPVKISHTINPGESVSGTISLVNASDEDVKVEAGVEDFIPAAGSINIEFVGRTEGVTTVRDWITIGGDQTLALKKGESRSIAYTIKAPAKAEPGGHFGVAFFKATGLRETGQLKISTRVGMLIFVTVPGNSLQKGKILNFSGPRFIARGPVGFTVKFENTGTVHFEPKGTIVITNIFGKTVGSIPVEGQVVLPTGMRDLTASWNVPGFLIGRYKAALTIVDGEGNKMTGKTLTFYALPIWQMLGFIAVALALFFGLRFLIKKVNFSISFKK